MSRISKKEVERIAKLARLSLSDEEVELFSSQLGDILDYVEKLNEVNTENIEPTLQPHPSSNYYRDDKQMDSLQQDVALKNAPESNSEAFIVPQVIK